MSIWRPLSERGAPSERSRLFDALHPGVPPWLAQPLLDWVIGGLSARGVGKPSWSRETLQRVHLELRLAESYWKAGPEGVGTQLLQRAESDHVFLLDLVDCLLKLERGKIGNDTPQRVRDLQSLLDGGGSA